MQNQNDFFNSNLFNGIMTVICYLPVVSIIAIAICFLCFNI